jgi:ATP-dependent DNA ligase
MNPETNKTKLDDLLDQHELLPMEAKLISKFPEPRMGELYYEPKWDGFRCIAYKDGQDIDLRSKSGQPLARYFPEIAEALRAIPCRRFVLDGELLIAGKHDFDMLLQRVHPAQSRIDKLSKSTPAVFVMFDMLAVNQRSLLKRPLSTRRAELEIFASKYVDGGKMSHQNERMALSPFSKNPKTAMKWLEQKSAKLDGVIIKDATMSYQSGTRYGMQKIKKIRTADCVVGGFRYKDDGKTVGSLLLGLYDDDHEFKHVGFVAGLTDEQKRALAPQLEKLKAPSSFTKNVPGKRSRWSKNTDSTWVPLKQRLVVEVQFDQVTHERFRHGAALVRVRPDKKPDQCTIEQIA